jgi:hypothetical protein
MQGGLPSPGLSIRFVWRQQTYIVKRKVIPRQVGDYVGQRTFISDRQSFYGSSAYAMKQYCDPYIRLAWRPMKFWRGLELIRRRAH